MISVDPQESPRIHVLKEIHTCQEPHLCAGRMHVIGEGQTKVALEVLEDKVPLRAMAA